MHLQYVNVLAQQKMPLVFAFFILYNNVYLSVGFSDNNAYLSGLHDAYVNNEVDGAYLRSGLSGFQGTLYNTLLGWPVWSSERG